MTRADTDIGLVRWGGDGSVSARNAIARQRRSGDLQDIYPGVSLPSADPPTFEQLAIAASWSARGFISHETAASLHGLRSWSQVRSLHISTLHDRARELANVTVHRRRHLADIDVVAYRDDATIASVALTLMDIAFAATPLALRSAYHDAWHRGLVTPAQVVEVIERLSRPGRPGGPKLRAMVDRYPTEGNPARSLNEIRMYDAIYDRSDLPNALLNFRVVRATGVEAFIDLAWPEYMYGVEVDHTETHAERWRHDVIRTEELNDIGWTIDRVMEDHVERELAATVARTRRRLIQHGMPS
jgi:very-short-patch-repair endonuclease